MKKYNVYIDESGDEGLGKRKGSKFFIITAIVVEKEKEKNFIETVKDIKKELQLTVTTQLHWNKIKGFPNKKYIIDTIAKKDFTIIHVIVDTIVIKYIKTSDIYFTYFNYLLERISLKTKDGLIDNIYISSRSGLSKEKLKENFKNSFNNIDLSKIKNFEIIANQFLALLQIADVCCSSFHQALKYDTKHTAYYPKKLKNKLFRNLQGKVLGLGIKTVPNDGNFKELKKLNLYKV